MQQHMQPYTTTYITIYNYKNTHISNILQVLIAVLKNTIEKQLSIINKPKLQEFQKI